MKEHTNTIAVLDIGSAKTVALICEIGDSGLRYRGHGMVESRGSHPRTFLQRRLRKMCRTYGARQRIFSQVPSPYGLG